jgi:hypothetical protein
MQPTSVAQQTVSTQTAPVTSQLRDFYKNIAGTPTSQQAEGDITQFGKLAPTTGSILSAFDQQYGVNDASLRVGELRKSVMNAEDLVNNVDDNVFARTSNALVSDSQRARLVAGEKDPLVKQLGVIGRNYDYAQQDLAGAQAQSNRFSGAEIGDINTMRTSLSERLGTAQQREEAARKAAAEAEATRQWWANFNQQTAQFESQMALKRQEMANAQAAANSSLALYQRQRADSQADAASERERQAAIEKEANKQRIFAESRAASEKQKKVQANMPMSYWDSIQNYGPLALVGGGWAWK